MVRKDKLTGDEQRLRLMEQELELLRNTTHPHIVKIMDMFEDEVNFYIVAELMRGGELYHYML